jgi:hypothetical protein
MFAPVMRAGRRLGVCALCVCALGAYLATTVALTGTAQAQGARRTVEEPLPIPPIPPELPASNYEAAPTPGSITAPVSGQGARGAELAPTLMNPKQFYQGEGFLAGSTVQSEQQRKAKPVAGFNLTVPLR